MSAVRPGDPKEDSRKARNIDSRKAVRKWKAREDRHLGGIEVRFHGERDTGNLGEYCKRNRTNERGESWILTSVFENRVQFETAELLLFTLHVDLELGFAPRYPITLNGIRLLRIPTTTTSLLADRGGIPKGISGEFAETTVGSGAVGGWWRRDLGEIGESVGPPYSGPRQMRDRIGWGGDDGGIGGMGEFGVAGQWTREGKIWGPWQGWEAVDLVITLDTDSGLGDRRGRGFECGYGNASRGVDEVEIGGIEKGDRMGGALSAEDTTTLSAVLMTNRN